MHSAPELRKFLVANSYQKALKIIGSHKEVLLPSARLKLNPSLFKVSFKKNKPNYSLAKCGLYLKRSKLMSALGSEKQHH